MPMAIASQGIEPPFRLSRALADSPSTYSMANQCSPSVLPRRIDLHEIRMVEPRRRHGLLLETARYIPASSASALAAS